MGRTASNLKLPEWATKIATWAFMAVIGAGFSVYMDTATHTQEIAVLKKDRDRLESEVARLRVNVDSNDEAGRKSLEKLDRIIAIMRSQRNS